MAIKIEIGATFDDADIKKAQRELEKLSGVASKQGKSITQSMDRIGDGMMKAGGAMTKSVTLPVVGAGVAMFQAFTKQEDAVARLNGALKANGGQANVTSEHIQDLAASLQKTTTFGDEVTISAAALLSTFHNVRNEVGEGNNVFDRTIVSAQNLSSALGIDLESATMQLAKAMENPTKGMSALSRSGTTFTKQQKDMVKAMEESGDTLGAQKLILEVVESQYDGMAEEMAGTSSGKMKQAFNALGDTFEQFGEIIAGVVNKASGFLQRLSERFQGLSPRQKELIVQIAAVAAAIGPLLMIGGKLIKTVSSVIKVVKVLNITLLTNPIFLIVAAVAALGFALFMAYQKFEGFREVVDKAFGVIKDVISFAWENVIKPIFEALVGAVQEHLMPVIRDLVASFQRAWPGIQSAMQTAWGVIQPILEFIIRLVVKIYSEYLKILIRVWSTVFKIVVKVLQVAWNIISTVFQAVASFITGTLVPIFQRIAEIAVTVWNAVSAAISAAWAFIQPILAAIWSFITDTLIPIFQRVAEIVGQVWGAISNAISIAWGFIQPILAAVFNFIASILVPVFQRIGAVAKLIWAGISAAIGVAWGIVSTIFKAVWNVISNTLVPIFQRIGSIVGMVWSGISAAIGVAWGIVSGIFTAIWGVITNTLVPIFNSIKSTAETVWSAISTAISTAWGTISGIFDNIKSGFQTVIDFFTGAKDTIGGIFGSIGDAISGAFSSAFDGIKNLWNSTLGGKGFSIPDIPGIPGRGQRFEFPTFAKGGIVPGIMGEPQLAIVHGGEQILRPSEVAGTRGSDQPKRSGDVNVYVNKTDADPYEIGRELMWAMKVAG